MRWRVIAQSGALSLKYGRRRLPSSSTPTLMSATGATNALIPAPDRGLCRGFTITSSTFRALSGSFMRRRPSATTANRALSRAAHRDKLGDDNVAVTPIAQLAVHDADVTFPRRATG